MDRFQAMQVFVRIAETNSLRRAADTMGIPASSVTSVLQGLEKALGVQLIQRTTRRLSLTSEGEIYLEHARRVLNEVGALEASFATKGVLSGRLKVDVAMSIGRQLLIPNLPSFLSAFPSITLMLNLGDRTTDIVEEGLSCAIRTGEIADSATLIARPLGAFRWQTCASPTYLASHGTPTEIDDLPKHRCLGYANSRTGRIMDWEFFDGANEWRHTPEGSLYVNDADSYAACGAKGLGIVQAGTYLLRPFIERGELKPILERYTSKPVPVSMVYAHHQRLSPIVRVFHSWLLAIFDNSELLQKTSKSTVPFSEQAP